MYTQNFEWAQESEPKEAIAGAQLLQNSFVRDKETKIMSTAPSLPFLNRYELLVGDTDKFSSDELTPILLGLYGEVGSIMTTTKKYYREKKAYYGYRAAAEEEFGDAFWYLSALCRRLGVKIGGELLQSRGTFHDPMDIKERLMVTSLAARDDLDAALIQLGGAAAQLLEARRDISGLKSLIPEFYYHFLHALALTGLDFETIVSDNLKKAIGRFCDPDPNELEDFDKQFPVDEQLPSYFEIHIVQRANNVSHLKWNEVFIGDPLTDNINRPDGYRFHDVFHMANAAVLHWSPTFRALIKHKRKSNREIDMQQDGGRARVVEEGLTAWLFSYAQSLDNFEGHDGVSFDALKTIQKFIAGYEVERCPLKLWEKAILQGYAVFRQVLMNKGGIVVGDRQSRTLTYRSIGENNED